jgi:hypothetical protein
MIEVIIILFAPVLFGVALLSFIDAMEDFIRLVRRWLL